MQSSRKIVSAEISPIFEDVPSFSAMVSNVVERNIEEDVRGIEIKLPEISGIKLMEHQQKAIRMFERSNRGFIMIHPTGSGKTLTSVIIAMNFIKTKSFNVFIVGTATTIQDVEQE